MGDKKVGIMTWYMYKNYGTILQSSAMCNVLQKNGYIPTMINYEPKDGNGGYDHSGILKKCFNYVKNGGNLAKKIWEIVKRDYDGQCSSEERDNLFDTYTLQRIKQTPLCRTFSELSELNNCFDAFLCGSDQIWSPLCYDDKYFLSFVENPLKMVAYAPSIGSVSISNEIIKERMSKHISRFVHLAVREQQGADLIASLTGQTAKVVLDPTLLMTSSEWDEYVLSSPVNTLNTKEYIICYFLGEEKKYLKYVKALSQELNVPFYIVPTTKNQESATNAVPFAVGPCEFVSLIKNAKFVCTDSFHGMAFSINYNVPFTVFKRFKDGDPKNQNSRIFSLLNLLRLENRIVDYNDTKDIRTMLECDFTDANLCLNEQRAISLDYLKVALSCAVNADDYRPTHYKITHMCCGCGACATVCPKGAISIAQNSGGFDHFTIDESKCVRCGKCKSVCPMSKVTAPDIKESVALYSIKSNSEQVLSRSSSGGIGYEVARFFSEQNYSVSGCMYDSASNAAKHIWITPDEKDKLALLQGSKYIQSHTADVLKLMSQISSTDKVVFFGTPCQVAAVDKLLRNKGLRDNALLIDLICHGVPSRHLWTKYLRDIDKKHKTGSNPCVEFRSKKIAWRRRLLVLSGNGNTYEKEEHLDDFYAFFRRGLCYMEVCSECPYRERSAADIRIGDYWGSRFENDTRGVSMVITNTEKGDALINALTVKNYCTGTKHDLSEYWIVQYPYNQKRPLVREKLIEELMSDKKDIHQLRKEYCSYFDRQERTLKIYRRIKKVLKRG